MTCFGVDDYLAHCRARGLSPNTVNQAYRYPLKGILLPFCAQQGITDVSGLVMIQAVYSHLSPGDAYEAMLRTLREED